MFLDPNSPYFIAIGSTDGKFLRDLIEFLNSYPVNNSEKTVIQDLAFRNPLEMMDKLSHYETEN